MQTKRIIILDDEEDNLILITELLKLAGYTNIDCFQNPYTVSAIFDPKIQSIIQADEIDLVLMDVMMPGQSGFEVCEKIKTTHPHVPVILITALNDTESQIHGIEVGADDFITKPIISARLTARVKSLLQHKHREDKLAANYESLKKIQKSLPAYVLKEKDQIQNYKVCRLMSESESSHIYEVRNEDGDRFALKILSDSLARTPEAIAQFRSEIDTLMSIDHSHIISIIEYGFHEGLPFYIMPLIPGEDLRKVLLRNHPISISCLIKVLRQIIETTHFLHKRNILHRDIKPENFIYADKKVTMIDFGLTIQEDKSLKSASGTESFIAPEVIKKLPPSPQSDVYALGILSYFLLNAELPSAEELSTDEAIYSRDDVPKELRDFINQAVDKNPKKRPNLEEYLAQLEELEEA